MEFYPFQTEDIEKLVRQTGALIGSEMGTGKTHEAIELEQQWYNPKAHKPSLVIAPLNTHDSWQEKYGWQAPDVDLIRINRKNRERFLEDIRRKRGDVFLMHWDALRYMPELQGMVFQTIVGDEVHRISNRKSQQTQLTFKLKGLHKLGMSGTASGDKPDGLWGPLHWLYPKYYRSYWKFRRAYTVEEKQYTAEGEESYTKITGTQNIDHLMNEIRPWYVRHLKREECCEHHPEGVMPWLPEKTYDQIWVDLNPTQRKFYEQMRKEMVAWVNENEDSPLTASIVVAQLQRLGQMALATPNIVGKKWVWRNKVNPATGETERVRVEVDDVRLVEPSSKLDATVELFKDQSNKQFLVGTSSRHFANLAKERYERSGISTFVLSSETSQKQRDGMVKRFANGDTQLFLSVIEAGAEGIDGLQHATDTVVMLDRSWRTIKNDQFIDRLHRDGQKNAVTVIDIMARNTVDLGRNQKLETKWKWIKEVLGDSVRFQQEVMRHD